MTQHLKSKEGSTAASRYIDSHYFAEPLSLIHI